MAETTIKLRQWPAPNFAVPDRAPGRRQDGWKELEPIPVNELSAETLAQMADDWRADLFRKAGKKDPRA